MENKKIESLIGAEIKCKPKMVRFYALRMIFELARGKPLTTPEQHALYNRASKANMDKMFNEKN